MDNLQELIDTLDARDKEAFSAFIQRHRYRKERKDLQLFQLLAQGNDLKPSELITKLDTSNINAYHTIRKRLFRHLSDFILLNHQSRNEHEMTHIQAMLIISRYLFDKGLYDLAWKHLQHAEHLAKEHEAYDVLNEIYLLQIDMAHTQRRTELDAFIKKFEQNKQLLLVDERFLILKSLVLNELARYRLSGKEVRFQDLADHLLTKLDLPKDSLQQPRLLLKLLQIMRAGTIASKDFYNFEPFLITSYQKAFIETDATRYGPYQIEILYMVCHTLYRNKKFNESLAYLGKLDVALCNSTRSLNKKYRSRSLQLKAADLMFLGRLDEAISILQEMLQDHKGHAPEATNNTILNLCMYRFIKNDHKETLKLFQQLSHSDNFYKKQMGAEWILKKNMMEVILFVDMQKHDIAENRIRAIYRSFGYLKENPIYRRGFTFLSLIEKYLHNPDRNNIAIETENAFEWLPKELEDLQAMAFYAWLRSKIHHTDYYTALKAILKD